MDHHFVHFMVIGFQPKVLLFCFVSRIKIFSFSIFFCLGVAYVRIELLGLNLHLFSTHMHAQYDLNEKIIDQYSIHRICQAYELGKFINLMSCNCTNTGSKDLIILAGDMNTSSKELPYKMLSMCILFCLNFAHLLIL